MNTRYYRHYNCEKEKKKTPELEEASKGLEAHLKEMKERLRLYQMEKGTWNPDKEEELYNNPDIVRKARR